MDFARYKDRQSLCKYDLDIEIFNNFTFKVYDVIPIRKVFILVTDDGNKILKRLEYDMKHLQFIYNAMEYIRNNGFTNIINFEKNKEGKICTKYNNSCYVVMNLIDGRECEFNNPIELEIASKTLSKLHIASEGFRDEDLFYRYKAGNLINDLNRKIEEIKIFKKLASSYEIKNEFDNLFLENVDDYIKYMEFSLQSLKESSYLKLASEEDKIVLCHHDLVYHNMIIKNEELYFIDFDYAILDLRVHDICNFINKVVKNFAFDFDKAKDIIENYEEDNKLDKRELEVLYSMICFPEDFYSIVKDYYKRRKYWTEEMFIIKLKRKLSYKEEKIEFLTKFREYYKLY